MRPLYQHIIPNRDPPVLTNSAFRAIIVSEVEVAQDWRNFICQWLLESGCRYVVAWGVDCELWHDTVDETNIAMFDFGDIPDDKFVMTTWHADTPLSEAMWFIAQCASHPDVELNETVIIHVALESREADMLKTYAARQTIHDN